MVKDPICGMMVDEKKAKFKSDLQRQNHSISAQHLARQLLINLQQNTQVVLVQQGTRAVAATTTAKS